MRDKALEKLIKREEKRQAETIDLIPSENFVSCDVREALGSVLTNKYSEGYPGKRYYPGNEICDEIELLAQKRLKQVFKLGKDWHVNVQPYSGSPANFAVYLALMRPGDTFLGLALATGGHLTHGHKVNFSGVIYKSLQYGINPETERIDYDALEKLAAENSPCVIVSGATAYPRAFDFERLGKIAKKVGAYHVADISHIAGLVLAGEHPSPFPHSDVVVSTTHKTMRGPRAAFIFCHEEIAKAIDRAVFPGTQGGPHLNQIAAMAVMAFEAGKPEFKKYQKQIVRNAKALVEALKEKGFRLVSGGTDNHMMLIDCKSAGLDGMTAQRLLEEAGIVANRNSIPGDASPFYPSGVRLGTPAVTTRGMKEGEMKKIAEWFARILIKKEKPAVIKKEVAVLCKKFPLNF